MPHFNCHDAPIITPVDLYIGQQTTMLRATSHMSLESLAHILDIPPSQLEAYENASLPMPASTLCHIAVILGIDLEHFIEGWAWS